jgi:aspartate aminotransferase-like enzyme
MIERPEFGTFFLPGPTEVRPEILAAMTRPMIGHRGAAFEEMHARIQAGLRHVFRTKRPVYVSSSSATGMMEASIRCAPPGAILSLVNGAFSERYARISQSCSRETDVIEAPLGQTFRLGEIEARLAEKRYAAVTVVHSETSTGVLTDVRAVSDLAHRYDTMCLVDSVSGIGGAALEFDAWGMDFVLTGSQKALALPPGLAFGVARSSLVERAKAKKDRGIYFDFIEFEKYILKHQTPNTPAVSLFYALGAQLDAICRETIEARWERHTHMARRTWEWADEMKGRGLDIRVLAPEGYRSTTGTCLTMPAGHTGSAVTADLKKRGFTIASGYGALKDATIRIGHMGDHTVAELDALLAELEQVLAS